jgi:hypothetical protein
MSLVAIRFTLFHLLLLNCISGNSLPFLVLLYERFGVPIFNFTESTYCHTFICCIVLLFAFVMCACFS